MVFITIEELSSTLSNANITDLLGPVESQLALPVELLLVKNGVSDESIYDVSLVNLNDYKSVYLLSESARGILFLHVPPDHLDKVLKSFGLSISLLLHGIFVLLFDLPGGVLDPPSPPDLRSKKDHHSQLLFEPLLSLLFSEVEDSLFSESS